MGISISKLALLPYKSGSRSALGVAEGLGVKCIRVEGSKFKDDEKRQIVNWGHSQPPSWYGGKTSVVNPFTAVDNASNKLKSLTLMKEAGVNVPDFTVDFNEVKSKIEEDDVNRYIGRTLLKGSGGEGCYFLSGREEDKELTEDLSTDEGYKLFTSYIPKSAEFRVHVFRGTVFDVTQKKCRKDTYTTPDYKIRSHERGWVFCRDDILVPDGVREEAIKAIDALNLDFGAVDIIWNRNKGSFVLEVNTAPGLEGQTLENYINIFKENLLEVGEV